MDAADQMRVFWLFLWVAGAFGLFAGEVLRVVGDNLRVVPVLIHFESWFGGYLPSRCCRGRVWLVVGGGKSGRVSQPPAKTTKSRGRGCVSPQDVARGHYRAFAGSTLPPWPLAIAEGAYERARGLLAGVVPVPPVQPAVLTNHRTNLPGHARIALALRPNRVTLLAWLPRPTPARPSSAAIAGTFRSLVTTFITAQRFPRALPASNLVKPGRFSRAYWPTSVIRARLQNPSSSAPHTCPRRPWRNVLDVRAVLLCCLATFWPNRMPSMSWLDTRMVPRSRLELPH